MSNSNSSDLPGSGRRVAALSAGGVGTAFCWLLFAPVAVADSSPSTPPALPAEATGYGTNPETAAAYAFLYNPDDWYATPNTMASGIATASGDYSLMNGDAGEAFAEMLGPEVAMYSELWQDFTAAGQLVEGAIGDGIDVANLAITAAGSGSAQAVDPSIVPSNLPDPAQYGTLTTLPTTDVDVSADSTATEYFTGIVNEANIVTLSLGNLRTAVENDADLSSLGAHDTSVVDVFNDVFAFQQQINGTIDALNNNVSLSDYDNNAVLNADLKGLLTAELNMNHETLTAEQMLSYSSVTGLAGVDGGFIGNSWAEYNYALDIINFFNEPDWLHSIGM